MFTIESEQATNKKLPQLRGVIYFFTVRKESRIRTIATKIRAVRILKILTWKLDSDGVKSHDTKIKILKKIKPIPSDIIALPNLSLKVKTSCSMTNLSVKTTNRNHTPTNSQVNYTCFTVVYRVSISGPSFVIATVCSKCAANPPSLVTKAYPSLPFLIAHFPVTTIGSIAITIPGTSFSPIPAFP